ncbi:hypothetical protein [Hymenobacter actinosclerus]|uniref:Lipocalin-like domain-containing protein n=1 Tax=Hymenobacter actinosclerus TaxID=82805 RepID=A0A1I0GKI4_9BACT|nr:hypothetical protein [Hymenobacter actinosclerus]SET70569.1 hypothetical protein SAMN04487998_2421 [Hymenobacter actinosclerus]
MKRFLLPVLAALALTLGSCEKEPIDCGCTPPPREPVTAASLTRTSTWYLSEYTAANQTTRADAIKDRFALRFAPDGSYRRILLSDYSETAGTWKFTDPDNRQLHLIDHKGDPQNFTVEAANAETLFLYRPDKTGMDEMYLFKTVR